jgi:hypothetical protein
MDAATALALQDFLDDADFDTLFGPWANAMGDEDTDGAGPDEDGGAPDAPRLPGDDDLAASRAEREPGPE